MKLGYLFSRYPLVSETFILREMEELAALGHELVVAPLLAAPRVKVHGGDRRLAGAIRVAPWLPADGLAGHLRFLRSARQGYARTWSAALWSHKSRANALAGALLFWPKAIAVARRFETAGVEHIHAHYATHPALVAWMVHRLTGIPFSFTVHAHDLFVHRAGLEAKLAAAAFVATVSEYNRQRLAEAYPRQAHKPVLVRCGVRPADYDEPPRPAGDSRLRLLSVASLQAYKGHAVLLAACERLRGRLDFSCRLVGGGPLRAPLMAAARQRGLASLISFAGPASEAEVAAELARADVFVLPSVVEPSGRMEGLPVALMEAMAAGLPVIASRLSGIPELVCHDQTGLLVPPGDPDALAAAVEQLRDPARRALLAAAGREAVRARFDLRHSALQLADLFAAAASGRERSPATLIATPTAVPPPARPVGEAARAASAPLADT